MKIYLIGDSISLQYGPHLKNYLRGIAECSRQEEAHETLLNLNDPQGANAGDSSMVLAFVRAKAETGGIDADLVLFNCGLHDIKTHPSTGARQIPLDRYRANLRAIVDILATMKPKPVWIRTTPCDEAVHNRRCSEFHRFSRDGVAYNQAADQVMGEAGVPSIDLYTFTLNLGPDLYCDHVHFHEPIREKQGAFIAGWVAACQGAAATMHRRSKP